MTIEVLKDETVIKTPKSVEFKYFQKLIDYINVVTIVNKSKALDADIADLN